LKRKILAFAKELPNEKILDKAAANLAEADQAALRRWRNSLNG
jgi:hypothetical protein